jgi:hypothetical protein
MSEEEQLHAGLTIAYLHTCLAAGPAFLADILQQPRAGSVAEWSLKDKDLLEPILLAGMYLHVAAEHYRSVESMFIPTTVPPGAPEPGVRNYSPYTLIRGAFEAEAWACWLLDPDVTPTARLGRAMTVRALNIREVRRLGLTDDSGKGIDYNARITRVSAVARRHQLAEKFNIDSDLVWVGAAPPNLTELLGELMSDRSSETNNQPLGPHTYSLLSARAHGDPWAVLHGATRGRRFGQFATTAELVIDVIELMRLLSISLRLYSEALLRAAVLDGRPASDWEGRRGATAESKLAARK